MLGPRPARDGEDRLEVDGCRAAEAPGKISGADGGISRNRLAAGMALMAGLQLAAHALPLLRPAW